MTISAYDKLKKAFHVRKPPMNLLRGGLVAVDKLDAEDFETDVAAGQSVVELFCSSIPYFTFLSDEAAFFYLPDLVQSITQRGGSEIDLILTLTSSFGRRILVGLTDEERAGVIGFLQTLEEEAPEELGKKMLDEIAKLVKDPTREIFESK